MTTPNHASVTFHRVPFFAVSGDRGRVDIPAAMFTNPEVEKRLRPKRYGWRIFMMPTENLELIARSLE